MDGSRPEQRRPQTETALTDSVVDLSPATPPFDDQILAVPPIPIAGVDEHRRIEPQPTIHATAANLGDDVGALADQHQPLGGLRLLFHGASIRVLRFMVKVLVTGTEPKP